MTDAELLARWYLVLAVAGIVVLLLAGLLLAILVTARRIEAAAARGLQAVRRIVEHTTPIWELDRTNTVAWELRERVRTIRRRAEEIAEALGAAAGGRA
ncbi:MAG: hypothetical protein QN119_12405 [Armatimonadota bacterium]|nr:hypothetical protein [Armatimonadota bacterium]